VATGMALAEKRKNSGAVVVCFLGTARWARCGIRGVQPGSPLAGPILYVVENNHIAQTTPVEMALSGEISARFNAFGIPTCELDTSDVLEIASSAGVLLGRCVPAERRGIDPPHGSLRPAFQSDDTRP